MYFTRAKMRCGICRLFMLKKITAIARPNKFIWLGGIAKTTGERTIESEPVTAIALANQQLKALGVSLP
jgi:hypothetical protein